MFVATSRSAPLSGISKRLDSKHKKGTYYEHMRIDALLKAREVMGHVAVRRWQSGVTTLDDVLSGGLSYGRMHEVFAAEPADCAAMAGFGVAVATGMAKGRPLLWLRSHRAARLGGVLQASGWSDLGGLPGQALCGILPDGAALLKTAVDALRCAEFGAIIVENYGALRELDLTASRRLALAAETSGVPLLLLRVDATPSPSAAQTRWQIAAAPSRALLGNAPGLPAFDLELLRQKSGPSGLCWRLEWDREQHCFREAAHLGAMVPVSIRRPVADTGSGPLVQNTRRAA